MLATPFWSFKIFLHLLSIRIILIFLTRSLITQMPKYIKSSQDLDMFLKLIDIKPSVLLNNKKKYTKSVVLSFFFFTKYPLFSEYSQTLSSQISLKNVFHKEKIVVRLVNFFRKFSCFTSNILWVFILYILWAPKENLVILTRINLSPN